MERLAREIAQAIVAAGERAPLESDVVEHLPEGDRHHGEIDAAPADHQRTEHRAGETAKPRAGKQSERRAVPSDLQHQAAAIGTETEPGGVTEGKHPGEAEEE